VYSDERRDRIPRYVLLKAAGVDYGTKKYKLPKVPIMGNGYETTCFSLIDQVITLYMAQQCKQMSHQGTIFAVTTGDLYVAKAANAAFLDPKSWVLSLTPDLGARWINQSWSLQEWTNWFMLVNNSAKDRLTLADK
jgi:hypothetical protein